MLRYTAILAALGWLLISSSSAQSLFTSLHSIEDGNAVIQQAARAVVKLETADGVSGSAVFISPRGHLLTNNHLLGVDSRNCAREGCFVRLSVDYQAGKRLMPAVEVFAEPRYVRSDLDATIFQIWTDRTKTKQFVPAHFLRIRAVSAPDLRGEVVTLIGHPLGQLKKFSQGRVFREQGEWFYCDNASLPGQSGGPYIDSKGFMVGLHHSYFGRVDRSTRRDSNNFAGGTAGKPISEMIRKGPDNRAFFSVREPHSEDDVLAYHNAYLMARETNAVLASGGPTRFVLDLLARKCDRALDTNTFESPEQFHDQMSWCSVSVNWMDCQGSGAVQAQCPTGSHKSQWQERYNRLTKKAFEFSSELFLSYLVSPAMLEKDAAAERAQKRLKLKDYLHDKQPEMSFELAYYLLDAGLGMESYRGQRPIDFVLNFRRDQQYRYQFEWIVGSLEPIYSDKLIHLPELMRLVQSIMADPHLSVSDMLFLEAFLHRNGFPLTAGRLDLN